MTAKSMTAASIQDLSIELKVLHKALLQAGRIDYEAEHGPVEGGMQLLHLVVQDPAFAWLRPISELMVDLDAMLDLDEPASEDDQSAARGELEHLLSPAGGELWARLTRFIQQEAEVAASYARVRQILLSLPKALPIDEAAALHAKHRWAEVRRHRRSG
jgi:hypothetical protein